MFSRINTAAFAKILSDGLTRGVIILDRKCRIVAWNHWMEKHSGIREGDILGQNIFEKYPEIQERNKDQYITECVKNKKVFLLSPLIHHHLIPLDIVKDDKRIRMFQNTKLFPFTDAQETLGAIIIIRDLTEQILYEKEIAGLNRLLRGIRNINQLITRVESETDLFSGACEILVKDTGYEFAWIGLVMDGTSEFRPATCAGIIHDIDELRGRWDRGEKTPDVIDSVIRTGKMEIVDDAKKHPPFRHCRQFTEKMGCQSVCVLPLKVESRVMGVMNICSWERGVFQGEELALLEEVASDISFAVKTLRDKQRQRQAEEEREKLLAQLRQSQKMEAIGTLAGGIAHDFNNILYPLIGYAEMTMEEAPENNVILKNMEEILTAAYRAKDLVQQILIFCRQSEQEVQPVRVHLIVKEALRFLRASLPATIEICGEISKKSEPVLADPTQIYQVLINLCINASHAMEHKGGTLEVTLSETEIRSGDPVPCPDMEPGCYVHLTVSDTGCGMDNMLMERIFEPYFTTREKGRGTGMGLAVVHGIIKAHNGYIQAFSTPGSGTIFHVFLPQSEVSRPADPKIAYSRPIKKGNERILFIDDEESIANMVQMMLKYLGYEVDARTSSIEALEIFRSQPDQFDLVITDLTMPEMTGDELSCKLMEIRSDIPIILCTGFSEKITQEEAQAMGIRKFITKPIGVRQFAEAVREALNK